MLPTLNHYLNLSGSNIQFGGQVIPVNFANSNFVQNNIDDMQLFQNFILANLENDSPVVVSMDGELNWIAGRVTHTFVITGITVDDQDPRNTIYSVSESISQTADDQYFTGSELARMFIYDFGMAFSQNNSFDFINQLINLNLPEPTYIDEFFNKDGDGDLHQNINLTKEIGIFDIADLCKYKSIHLSDLYLKTVYSGLEMNIKMIFDIHNLLNSKRKNERQLLIKVEEIKVVLIFNRI